MNRVVVRLVGGEGQHWHYRLTTLKLGHGTIASTTLKLGHRE
jgi:hypothetical protein